MLLRTLTALSLAFLATGCDTTEAPVTEPDSPIAPDAVSELVTRGSKEVQAQIEDKIDPTRDGWTSEALGDQAQAQFNRLGDLMLESPVDPGALAAIVSDDYQGGPLRPAEVDTAFADEGVRVVRGDLSSDAREFNGREGLVAALTDLSDALTEVGHRHYKFKVITVTAEGDEFETRAYLELDGWTEDRSINVASTWQARWRQAEDGNPVLVALTASDYEEVIGESIPSKWFVDRTRQLIGDNEEAWEQLSLDANFWAERIERNQGHILIAQLHGLAMGDANGDGLDDIYLPQAGGLPNRLLLQNPDGTPFSFWFFV